MENQYINFAHQSDATLTLSKHCPLHSYTIRIPLCPTIKPIQTHTIIWGLSILNFLMNLHFIELDKVLFFSSFRFVYWCFVYDILQCIDWRESTRRNVELMPKAARTAIGNDENLSFILMNKNLNFLNISLPNYAKIRTIAIHVYCVMCVVYNSACIYILLCH